MATLSETWTDYDGDSSYGDFTVTSGGVPMQAKQYEPGLGTIDNPIGSPVSKYLHNNNLGTLRTATTSTGSFEPLRVFTAFGEEMSNESQRYGYVGGWGYQSNTGSSLLHVGARYYNPASGRFLQRDPIGIRGGRNVYAYVGGSPTGSVDPTGKYTHRSFRLSNTGRIRYGLSRPLGGGARRLAFRIGSKGLHLFGAAGAGAVALSCVVAAGVGAGAGYAINKGTQAVTGKSLSNWIADSLFSAFTGRCPGC